MYIQIKIYKILDYFIQQGIHIETTLNNNFNFWDFTSNNNAIFSKIKLFWIYNADLSIFENFIDRMLLNINYYYLKNLILDFDNYHNYCILNCILIF